MGLYQYRRDVLDGFPDVLASKIVAKLNQNQSRDVPVGVPLDLSTPTVMEWHELPKYNGIQVSQLI